MLSSVLKSRKAIQVNIAIMRAFVQTRTFIAFSKELATRLNALERDFARHDEAIVDIFRAIHELIDPPAAKPVKRIGFH